MPNRIDFAKLLLHQLVEPVQQAALDNLTLGQQRRLGPGQSNVLFRGLADAILETAWSNSALR